MTGVRTIFVTGANRGLGGARSETPPGAVAARILAMQSDGTLHGASGLFLNVGGSDHLW